MDSPLVYTEEHLQNIQSCFINFFLFSQIGLSGLFFWWRNVSESES